MNALGEAVGVERDVPHGVAQIGIAHKDKYDTHYDKDEGGGIATAGDGGEPEGHASHEQDWEHQFCSQTYRIDGLYQYVSNQPIDY